MARKKRTVAHTKLVCPKRWRKLPVKRSENGGCYVVRANGQRRFVRKVKITASRAAR